MDNKWYKVIVALLLSIVISVIIMPSINSYAATPNAITDVAIQKKQAKKAYKYMINKTKAEASSGVKISGSYKKTGKRYVFNIIWATNFSIDEMPYKTQAHEFDLGYESGHTQARSLSFYKEIKKKYKLYKPIVYVILKTNDGTEIVSYKNGHDGRRFACPNS